MTIGASNGRVCANANCHHTEFDHVNDMCWGKPKEIRKNGPTPGCRCNGFVARRLCVASIDMSIIGATNILEVPKAQRWRFVSDYDGHDYLIPADKEQEFNEWVSSFDYEPHYEGEEPQEYTGPDFYQFLTGMSPNNYTFTDPKEDK